MSALLAAAALVCASLLSLAHDASHLTQDQTCAVCLSFQSAKPAAAGALPEASALARAESPIRALPVETRLAYAVRRSARAPPYTS